MKRDFLKNLGIEDKEIIDKILDENSKDIGKVKNDSDDLESKVSQLTIDLNKKTSEFDTLKESTKDYKSLKDTIKQLELDKANLSTENAQLKIDVDNKVAQIQKTHAIENSVRDAKAKNVKAVVALLDMEKITYENGELSGVTEQLENLKGGEDTSFLFGESGVSAPKGTHLNNPPTGGQGGNPPTSKTLADAVAKALTK